MDNEEQEVVQAPCNECRGEPKHLVLGHRQRTRHGDPLPGTNYGPWSEENFRMLECCGCEDVKLERRYFFSEWDYEDGDVRTYFPPPQERRPPKWVETLEPIHRQLFGETYSAMSIDSRCLAAMGARAILDVFLVDAVTDIGGFPEKVNALKQKQFASEQEADFLDATLQLGNAAAHRAYAPSASDLNTALDIVESMLLKHYVLRDATSRLRAATPKRNTEPKRKGK